jgi:carbon storage regulator
MLVLTRHAGEQIVIAGDIVVTVVAIEGSKIRLGIEAPKSVRVDRKEVHARRVAEREYAAALARKDAGAVLAMADEEMNF